MSFQEDVAALYKADDYYKNYCIHLDSFFNSLVKAIGFEQLKPYVTIEKHENYLVDVIFIGQKFRVHTNVYTKQALAPVAIYFECVTLEMSGDEKLEQLGELYVRYSGDVTEDPDHPGHFLATDSSEVGKYFLSWMADVAKA